MRPAHRRAPCAPRFRYERLCTRLRGFIPEQRCGRCATVRDIAAMVCTPHADCPRRGLEASAMRPLGWPRDHRQRHAAKEVPWPA
jgi:hypothetical protein